MKIYPLTRWIRKSERGQSIVEITLITPLLLIALYVPADFGIAFFMGNMLATAAREGARVGSGLDKTGGGGGIKNFGSSEAVKAKNAAFNVMPNNVRLSNRKVFVTFYEGTIDPSSCMEVIEVTAQADYNYFLYQLIRLFGISVSDSTTISRTTQIRYNYQTADFNDICTTTPEVDHIAYTS
jgi:TadE-like protein